MSVANLQSFRLQAQAGVSTVTRLTVWEHMQIGWCRIYKQTNRKLQINRTPDQHQASSRWAASESLPVCVTWVHPLPRPFTGWCCVGDASDIRETWAPTQTRWFLCVVVGFFYFSFANPAHMLAVCLLKLNPDNVFSLLSFHILYWTLFWWPKPTWRWIQARLKVTNHLPANNPRHRNCCAAKQWGSCS